MKDEFAAVTVNESVELKSKIYSIKKLMVKNIIQQKKWVLQLSLINLNYLMKKLLDSKSNEFKVKKVKLGTYEIAKISLSFFDNKRYVLDDGIRPLTYFHKDNVKEIHDNWKKL